MRYGIKSITMDDIAKGLGMSKKTLYQYVDNKKDLVYKVMNDHISCEKEALLEIHEKAGNAIEEMIMIGDHISHSLRKMHAAILYDLQKYYPQSWKQFTSFKVSFIYDRISNNIKRGQEEGQYRTDFNVDIVARIYIARIEMVFDQTLFPPQQFGILKIYKEYLMYHMRSIVSDEGKDYLEKQNLDQWITN